MSRPPDLRTLLAQLDPQAPLAERHLWLIRLFDWIRGDQRSVEAAVSRVRLFLDAVDAHEGARERLAAWWQVLARTVDITTLLADFGFAPRTAFVSELSDRIRRKLLPATPETQDAAELFRLVLPGEFDARWLAQLDDGLLARLSLLLGGGRAEGFRRWQRIVLEAITFCTSQVVANGYASELRLRMGVPVPVAEAIEADPIDADGRGATAPAQPEDPASQAQPFHALTASLQRLRAQVLRAGAPDDTELQAALQDFRERLDACRQAAASVYTHLEDHGISVGLVFRLRQLRERVLRIRELMDCLASANAARSAARLISRLVIAGREGASVRALIAANSSLLAAKVAERSAETGASYITRTWPEYKAMVRRAAGGGALMSITTLVKFMLLGLGLSAFWGGFFAGFNYAASFVAIQLLHLTVATKQPAMTAPAMAARLKGLDKQGGVESFVDQVTRLVRTQVAAVLGNVMLVVPCVLLLSYLILLATGHPMISTAEAEHVLHSLTLLGPTLFFAAFTGVLLFSSSIIAGWVENWFVLHNLDSAMRYNPRITRILGSARADRWAGFMRRNISGLTSNISLGFMLGLIPAFTLFFGVPMEVRHVTLSSGQIAAAAAAYDLPMLASRELLVPILWCAAGAALTGVLNVGVSFFFAFRLALRAQNVSGLDRARIRSAIWARWRQRPLSFFLPARASTRTAPRGPSRAG
ncbi:MAG: site-specific recombinase [Burkholderiaceae bacterium]|nr:site-specific recombinase [Burkholderiaceae bacterium]